MNQNLFIIFTSLTNYLKLIFYIFVIIITLYSHNIKVKANI